MMQIGTQRLKNKIVKIQGRKKCLTLVIISKSVSSSFLFYLSEGGSNNLQQICGLGVNIICSKCRQFE
jgi:hypothetical protein